MFKPTNPAVRDRINAYNGLLSHDKLLINTDKCPNLVNALESQGYDKKGEPEKFSDHPAIDDWADSSGYFIAYKFPVIRNNISSGKMWWWFINSSKKVLLDGLFFSVCI